MYTEFERNILIHCGWTLKELEYQGVKVYKAEDHIGKYLARVVSRANNEFISVDVYLPDETNGETIKMCFDRKLGEIVQEETDSEIIKNNDFNSFLSLVSSTVKICDGSFMPSKKIN